MYEGLVKSLRWLGFMFPETHPAQDDADRMSNNIHLYCTQAADAIEDLIKKLIIAEDESGLYDALPTVIINEPQWISVEERLPEDGSLVGKLIADSEGYIRIASKCAKFTLSGGKTVYTDLIDLVSFLAKDTPTTEWEDCTHITHWQPLPEPPKEET